MRCPSCAQFCAPLESTCSTCGAGLRQSGGGGGESPAGLGGVIAILIAGIAWGIYRAIIRTLFGLPHWIDIVLLILLSAAISYGLLRFIGTFYRVIRKRPMTRKASLIIFAALVTMIVPNLLTPPSAQPAGSRGPTNSMTIRVPAIGLSSATGMSGTTVYVEVLPKDSVWMYSNGKRVDAAEFTPYVFDELQFVSRNRKPVTICVAQFSFVPTQKELDAHPSPCLTYRR